MSQPGTGASGSPASSATGRQSAAAAANYEISQWTGDNFNRGHELRDGSLPKFPAKAEKTVEFVIIGGGMSGLAKCVLSAGP